MKHIFCVLLLAALCGCTAVQEWQYRASDTGYSTEEADKALSALPEDLPGWLVFANRVTRSSDPVLQHMADVLYEDNVSLAQKPSANGGVPVRMAAALVALSQNTPTSLARAQILLEKVTQHDDVKATDRLLAEFLLKDVNALRQCANLYRQLERRLAESEKLRQQLEQKIQQLSRIEETLNKRVMDSDTENGGTTP